MTRSVEPIIVFHSEKISPAEPARPLSLSTPLRKTDVGSGS